MDNFYPLLFSSPTVSFTLYGIASMAPVIIGITATSMLWRFLSSLERSKYLSNFLWLLLCCLLKQGSRQVKQIVFLFTDRQSNSQVLLRLTLVYSISVLIFAPRFSSCVFSRRLVCRCNRNCLGSSFLGSLQRWHYPYVHIFLVKVRKHFYFKQFILADNNSSN